jgi:hypothetical protein
MTILGFAQTGEGLLFRVVDLASRGIDLVEAAVAREPVDTPPEPARSCSDTEPLRLA